MNEFFTKRFINNIWLKVLSLVLAVLAWCMIMNSSDPNVKHAIRNITVTQTNIDAVTDESKIFDIVQGNVINITVSGPRSEVQNLIADDVNAYVDLRELSITNACPIHIEFKNAEATKNVEIVAKSEEVMVLSLEDMITETKQVHCMVTGSTYVGYYPVATANPLMLEVYGSQNNVTNIERLIAFVDVTDKVESYSVKAKVVPVDSEGNPVDTSNITISSETVDVDVDVHRTKSVNVVIDYDLKAEYGFACTGFEQAPKTVTIAGSSTALAGRTEIRIPYKAENLKDSISDNISIREYLPAGCYLVSDIDSVSVTATVERLTESREMTVLLRNVEMRDLSDEYEIKGLAQSLKVKVWGAEGKTADLTNSELKLVIDCSGIDGTGSYTAKVVSENSTIMIDELEATFTVAENSSKKD